jgi:hypothetical protein
MVHSKGTIQEVYTHLKTLNPNFENEYPPVNVTTPSNRSGTLAKRYDVSSHFCEGRWVTTESSFIRHGISYLNGVRGQPRNGPGPSNCGRVSCSYDSAIWWCNDVSG